MVLMVYGKPVEVHYVGFVASFGQNDEADIGDTKDDVYAAADGRKFVEVYITTSWREYDAEKDGPIWTEDTWNAAKEQHGDLKEQFKKCGCAVGYDDDGNRHMVLESDWDMDNDDVDECVCEYYEECDIRDTDKCKACQDAQDELDFEKFLAWDYEEPEPETEG